MSARYYVQTSTKTIGPVDALHLKRLADRGKVLPEDLIQRDGSDKWTAASNVKGLFETKYVPREDASFDRQALFGRISAEMERLSTAPKEEITARPEKVERSEPGSPPKKTGADWSRLAKLAAFAGLAVAGFFLFRFVQAADPAKHIKLFVESGLPSELTEEAEEEDGEGAPLVRKAGFNRVKEGMSYEEVCEITGSPGLENVTDHVKKLRVAQEREDIVGYIWRNPDSSHMTAIFVDDELIEKAQYGLY